MYLHIKTLNYKGRKSNHKLMKVISCWTKRLTPFPKQFNPSIIVNGLKC